MELTKLSIFKYKKDSNLMKDKVNGDNDVNILIASKKVPLTCLADSIQ